MNKKPPSYNEAVEEGDTYKNDEYINNEGTVNSGEENKEIEKIIQKDVDTLYENKDEAS